MASLIFTRNSQKQYLQYYWPAHRFSAFLYMCRAERNMHTFSWPFPYNIKQKRRLGLTKKTSIEMKYARCCQDTWEFTAKMMRSKLHKMVKRKWPKNGGNNCTISGGGNGGRIRTIECFGKKISVHLRHLSSLVLLGKFWEGKKSSFLLFWFQLCISITFWCI